MSSLDAGSWFAPEFAGERVPLLRDGLEFARAVGMLAYLDVKSTATGPAGLAAIVSVLEEYQDISQHLLVGVWSEEALANANAARLPELSQLSFIGALPPAQASFERFIALNRASRLHLGHHVIVLYTNIRQSNIEFGDLALVVSSSTMWRVCLLHALHPHRQLFFCQLRSAHTDSCS